VASRFVHTAKAVTISSGVLAPLLKNVIQHCGAFVIGRERLDMLRATKLVQSGGQHGELVRIGSLIEKHTLSLPCLGERVIHRVTSNGFDDPRARTQAGTSCSTLR